MTASCASAVLPVSVWLPPQAVRAAMAASTPDACKKERRESFFIIILFSQFPDISKVAISLFYSKVGTNAT